MESHVSHEGLIFQVCLFPRFLRLILIHFSEIRFEDWEIEKIISDEK